MQLLHNLAKMYVIVAYVEAHINVKYGNYKDVFFSRTPLHNVMMYEYMNDWNFLWLPLYICIPTRNSTVTWHVANYIFV